MRILNFFLAIMFLVFAFLQVNDPDPVVWILIYGVMAVYCVMAIFEFYPQKFLLGTIAIFVLYSLLFVNGVIDWLQSDNKVGLFDDLAKMQYPYIEESREFIGLAICIAVLVFYYVRSRRIQRPF
ncbi:MAG TPA: transmembrane 220 family protein [Ohtaekwangia sp.]|nr:transmembrane 220 family protein [Ohtaekwangia sp.]